MATRGKKGRSSSFDKAREVFAQQIAHAVGKGMTRNQLVHYISGLMSTPVLMWLKALGPAFMAASTDSGLKFIQQQTGMFKDVTDPLLMEVLEAVFTGFFTNLPAGDATTDQAWSAMNKATTEAAAKFGRSGNPAAANAVKKAGYVINDDQLRKMISLWGSRQTLQILRLYNIGIAAMALAAFDPNTPPQVAMDAQFAFDDGDFSDVMKILTFAYAVRDNMNDFERMVRAVTPVVLANTAKKGMWDKVLFMGARMGSQAVNSMDGGFTQANLFRVIGNWVVPTAKADAQIIGFLLVSWIVFYMATAIPWFILAPRGQLVWLVFFAVLNMLNNISILNLFFAYVGAHGDVASTLAQRFGLQGDESKKNVPDVEGMMPFKWHGILRFRWQATSPLLVGTALRFVFQLLIGPASFTFIYSMGLMVTAIATAVLIVIRARSIDEDGKKYLNMAIQWLPTFYAFAVGVNILFRYVNGQLPAQGMWFFGGVWELVLKFAALSIGGMTALGVGLLLARIANNASKEKSYGVAMAAAAAVLCIGLTADLIGKMPSGAERRQARVEQEALEHQRDMERLNGRAAVAAASAPPPIQIFGSSMGEARHNAMMATGGPTRREDHQRYGTAPQGVVLQVQRPAASPPRNTARGTTRRHRRSQAPNLGDGSLLATNRFDLVCGDAPFTASNYSQRSGKQRYEVDPGNRVAVVVKLRGSSEYRYVPTSRGGVSCAERAWLRGPNSQSGDYSVIDDLYVLQLDSNGLPVGGRRITGNARRQATLHACGGSRCGSGYNATANRLAARLL